MKNWTDDELTVFLELLYLSVDIGVLGEGVVWEFPAASGEMLGL